MFYWKALEAGSYQARRDGVVVATIRRENSTDRKPLWFLEVLDDFARLGDAQFAYGYAYRMLHQED